MEILLYILYALLALGLAALIFYVAVSIAIAVIFYMIMSAFWR